MRQTRNTFLRGEFFDGGDRAGHQLIQRQGGVGDTVNERGVGTVFQQAAHQVSQQGFVGADRGVNTARTVEFAVSHFTYNLLVQRFTHAVQALELILAGVVILSGEMINRRQRMGVMGGELRINQVRHCQQFFRAGEIRDIGIHLTGIHRIAFQPFHLGAFDFAVPVRAFHQTDHQTAAATGCQINQVINHERAALHIGLNDKADAVPASQLRFKTELLQQIEGDFQAIGFFGIDVDTDIILAGQQRQGFQARVKFFHHPVILGAAIARMQRR